MTDGAEGLDPRDPRAIVYAQVVATNAGNPRAFNELLARCGAVRDRTSVELLAALARRLLEARRLEQAITAAFHAHMQGTQSRGGALPMRTAELNAFLAAAADEAGILATVSRHSTGACRRARLAHVHSGLGAGHAPTTVVSTLVAHHDRDRFEPFVYLTEAWMDSRRSGAAILNSLLGQAIVRRLEPPASFAPSKVQSMIDQMAEDEIDIAVFHTHYCPVTVMSAMRRVAPLMVGFVHGGAIHGSQIDHHLVQGEAGMAAVDPEIRSRAVPILLGADVTDAGSPNTPSLDEFGPDSVRLGTLGHLYKYADRGFATLIADILERHEDAVWLYAGRSRPDDLRVFEEVFRERSVLERTCYLGQLSPAAAACMLASLDVYINSYPRPGGLAVLEAMASGLPVVSLRSRDPTLTKAQVSYEYLGFPEFLFEEAEKDRFVETALRLLGDKRLSREVGDRYKERYSADFTARAGVARIDEVLWELWIDR